MSRTDVVALADTVGKAIEKVLTTVFPAKVEEDPLVRRLRVRAGLVTLPEPVLLNNPRWCLVRRTAPKIVVDIYHSLVRKTITVCASFLGMNG